MSAEYWRIDVPVDLVAGLNDGVIGPENIRAHYEAMKAGDVDVQYSEFAYGHLQLNFAVRQEMRDFIVSKLLA